MLALFIFLVGLWLTFGIRRGIGIVLILAALIMLAPHTPSMQVLPSILQ